jgi:hypothetical protein
MNAGMDWERHRGSGLPWHPSMHMTIMVWGSICVNGEVWVSGKRLFHSLFKNLARDS